jgi:hypothetical protein
MSSVFTCLASGLTCACAGGPAAWAAAGVAALGGAPAPPAGTAGSVFWRGIASSGRNSFPHLAHFIRVRSAVDSVESLCEQPGQLR